jgi:chromosomal replication initiator protein
VVSPADIISIAAPVFISSASTTFMDLHDHKQLRLARQVAMYLCREMTSLSLPKIGQLFGNRDHTTVMYANKKISELMKERRSIYNQVTEITSRVKQTSSYEANQLLLEGFPHCG